MQSLPPAPPRPTARRPFSTIANLSVSLSATLARSSHFLSSLIVYRTRFFSLSLSLFFPTFSSVSFSFVACTIPTVSTPASRSLFYVHYDAIKNFSGGYVHVFEHFYATSSDCVTGKSYKVSPNNHRLLFTLFPKYLERYLSNSMLTLFEKKILREGYHRIDIFIQAQNNAISRDDNNVL